MPGQQQLPISYIILNGERQCCCKPACLAACTSAVPCDPCNRHPEEGRVLRRPLQSCANCPGVNVGHRQAARAPGRAGGPEGAYRRSGAQPGRGWAPSSHPGLHRSPGGRPPKGTRPSSWRHRASQRRRTIGGCAAAGRLSCSGHGFTSRQGLRLPWPRPRTHARRHPLTAGGQLRRMQRLWSRLSLCIWNLLFLLGMRADFGPVHPLQIPSAIKSDSGHVYIHTCKGDRTHR